MEEGVKAVMMAGMKLRAIAVDVDRTLTDEALLLDLDAIRVIRLLEAAGIPVVLCSGRDIIALGALAHYLGTNGLVVAEDGAVLGRFTAAHYDARLLAKPERAHQGLTALQEALGSAIQVIPVPSRLASFVLTRTFDRATANRILAARGIEAKVADSALSFQLADRDIDKGTGLVEAAARLGIEVGEMMAVGDSLTDVDMFRVAGWSAAVGNASAEVKAEAAYACAAPYGQGFIEAVRRAVDLFRPDLAGLSWPVVPSEGRRRA